MNKLPMNEKKKILTLIIQKKFFDKIISGEKKIEYRELRPTTYRKYVVCDSEGHAQMNPETQEFIPIKYDFIQFYVGYNKDRESALVEWKDAKIVVFVDDNDEVITYDYYGKEYWLSQIEIDLGAVINVKRPPKEE